MSKDFVTFVVKFFQRRSHRFSQIIADRFETLRRVKEISIVKGKSKDFLSCVH